MSALALRSEEQVGLGVAIVAHVVLIALLALLAVRKHMVIPLPERMTVSLVQDVAPVSTAPKPADEAQAAIAETLAETPKPVEKKPEAKKPEKSNTPPPMQRTTSREQSQPQPANDKSGGSLIGKNFLEGEGASTVSENKAAPATQVGPEVRAALAQAVARQLKPHWQQPVGLDVDKLATTVEWSLNPDGSLAGDPRVIGTTGIDASNRPQVGRHQEMAVRAVRLAAPFRLPPDYYSAWRRIKFTFDWKLN
jgi:hypothetical protein